MKDYKGYSAKITLDEERGIFYGEIAGITDVVTFQGRTPEDLARAFHESVDDYLEFCKERGEKADKPNSGRFVVRITPELHRRVALAAKSSDRSMNEWITAILKRAAEAGPGLESTKG